MIGHEGEPSPQQLTTIARYFRDMRIFLVQDIRDDLVEMSHMGTVARRVVRRVKFGRVVGVLGRILWLKVLVLGPMEDADA